MVGLADALVNGTARAMFEFDEEKHPKGADGRFIETGGSGEGSKDAPLRDDPYADGDVRAEMGHRDLPPASDPAARAVAVTDWMQELRGQDRGDGVRVMADGRPSFETQQVHDMLRDPETGERIKGSYDQERRDLHDQIIDRMLAEAIKNGATQDREAILMAGLPGAGKTSILNDLVDPSRYVMINPDDMKTALAEADAVPHPPGVGEMEASTLIHEESSDLAWQLANRATEQGYNVIWDFSMSSERSAEERLRALRNEDPPYKVTGILIDVPVEQAERQTVRRYAQDIENDPNMARPLPPAVFDKLRIPERTIDPIRGYTVTSTLYSKNAQVFHELTTQHGNLPSSFDRSILVDNTGFGRDIRHTTGDPFDSTGHLRLPGGERYVPGAGHPPAARERVAASGAPPMVTFKRFRAAYHGQLQRRDEIEIELHSILARVFATQGRVVRRRLVSVRREVLAQDQIALTAAGRHHHVQPAAIPQVKRPVVQLRASEVFMGGFDDMLDEEMTAPLEKHASHIGAALVGVGLFGAGVALNSLARSHVDSTLDGMAVSGRTAIRDVEGVLADSYQNGGDYDTMIDGVDGVFDRLAGARAAQIARDTTTGLLAGMGTIAGRLAGVDTQRVWVTMEDDRVRGTNPRDRFDHVEAHGQIVGLDEPFIVSGEELQYPGDPNASPGNRYNCRCWIELVSPDDTEDIPLNEEADGESA